MSFVVNGTAAIPHLCRAVAFGTALALGGCASMAGVGGSAEFGCKAPVGVKCDSVSGNYYNAVQQNLPSQQKSGGNAPENSAASTLMDRIVGKSRPTSSHNDALPIRGIATPVAIAPEANAPLRSPARVLRLWIKPWEDSDGDLHTQSYVYVPIDAGRWLVDHREAPMRDVYTPTKATRAVRRTAPAAETPVTPTALRAAGGTQDASREGDDDVR